MMTVFRFTYLDAVRKKAFKITTIVIALVIVLACAAVNIFGDKGEDAAESVAQNHFTSVYYLDEENVIDGAEEALLEYGYLAERVGSERKTEITQSISENDGPVLIEVSGEERPMVCVYVKDFMADVNTEGIRQALSAAWTAGQLRDTGLSREEITYITQPLTVYREALGEMNPMSFTLGLVFTMLMFFAIYFYGLMVANSVATEKTSRVMETLVVSARPRSILLGKCLASGAAGLTQMGLLVLIGVLSVKIFIPSGVSIMGVSVSLSGLTVGTGLVLVAYFLLGYALYAMMNAVCGASVSRIEDVSSAEMPLALIAMVSFYVGYFTAMMGSAGAVVDAIAVYVPFCSPFAMPMRLLNGGVRAGQTAASLGILAATIVVVSIVCARLYEASVMYYGQRLKLKDMLKLKK